MPYYTGSVGSLAALRTAVLAALQSEGWTLAGNVIHKGGCYVDLQVGTSDEEDNFAVNGKGRLIAKIGNGIDGSNLLTDAIVAGPRIGPLMNSSGTAYTDWDWPVNYHLHIHTNPDEVYLLVNYFANQYWQNLCWGKSPAEGNAGTGNWVHGTIPRIGRTDLHRRVNGFSIAPGGSYLESYNLRPLCGAPFFWQATKETSYDIRLSSQIHGAFNQTTGAPLWSDDYWPLNAGSNNAGVSSGSTQDPLLSLLPNTWNQEVALIPCQIFARRPENKVSLVGELGHLRFTRNDYYDPGHVISLGPDRWKVYPVYRKDAANRNGGAGVTHSGTIAMAIRYDGP